ncbi:hypothetical protein [Clostridium neonatale]|uniref:Uncharacterized protein n=1 Tax=Clostridium neonatale TaxID=137838 RepID=A0AA86JX07_9CLOT|nr:hypothetical protein CNEO_30012 [Clostridium neonatale]
MDFIEFSKSSNLYFAVTQIEEEYLSKVSGIINAFALATVPITSFIVGIIIEYISTRMLFGLFE